MIRTLKSFAAILVLIGTGQMASQAAWAQSEASSDRLVTVTGEGVVRVIPDQATVRFGIATRNDDPEEARRQNAETARETMNAVRELGIDERKLRLETLQLQPVREYDPETRRPEDKGFEALRDLVVELEDLELLPTLISQIIQKGANRLNGVTYGLKDRETIRDQALVEAVTRARHKATLMASTLGGELGPVRRLNEQSIDMPFPMVRMAADQAMMMAKSEAAPEPEAYAAGEMEVRAVVQVTFVIQ
jgi:uncharacterized protein YggE